MEFSKDGEFVILLLFIAYIVLPNGVSLWASLRGRLHTRWSIILRVILVAIGYGIFMFAALRFNATFLTALMWMVLFCLIPVLSLIFQVMRFTQSLYYRMKDAAADTTEKQLSLPNLTEMAWSIIPLYLIASAFFGLFAFIPYGIFATMKWGYIVIPLFLIHLSVHRLIHFLPPPQREQQKLLFGGIFLGLIGFVVVQRISLTLLPILYTRALSENIFLSLFLFFISSLLHLGITAMIRKHYALAYAYAFCTLLLPASFFLFDIINWLVFDGVVLPKCC